MSVTKGYSTPAIGTLIFTADGVLKPEDYWQYEAGIGQEFGDALEITLSAYQTEGQNTLKIDPVDKMAKNNGFTLIRGAEGSMDIKIAGVFGFGGSVSYYEPGDKSSDTSLLTAGAYVKAARSRFFSVKVSADFAKNRYGSDGKLDKLGDYMLLSASGSLAADYLGIGSGYFVEAGNILNTKYEVKKGYPGPGFIIKGGVLIKL
jgi:outer membrane cobalamin receptor